MINRRLTLYKRMQLYSAFVIIPLILISIFQYMVTLESAEKSAIKFSNQIIVRITSEIEDILIDYNNISLIISEDPEILEVLNQPLSTHLSEKFATDYDIDSRLYYMTTYNKQLNGIYLIAENGGKYKSNYMTFREEDLRETAWYQKIISENRTIWFGNHNESFAANSSGKSMISMGAPVKDANTGNILGVVIIDIEESVLSKLINSEIGSEGIIFVIDENNKIVSHPDRNLISTEFELSNDIIELEEYGASSSGSIQDGKSVIVYKSLNINSWKIVASLPKSKMTEDIDKIRMFALISGIFLIFANLFVTWKMSGKVLKPIRKMMTKMKLVEDGDLSVSMSIDSDDELGDLSKSFNNMIYKVDGLMNTIYEEQKNIRKAELKALQSQINPHFLYNTMSTIIWMARINETDQIVKLVTAITKYYRVSISRGRDIIKIADEVGHMDSYLFIMNQQYGDQFDYQISMPEELYEYNTLKLILQPLVENAIYHGIKNIREKGEIHIIGSDEGDEILFKVVDSGAGMTKEQLEKLTLVINDFSGAHPESYGLRNVNERLKIFFGQEYGIEIKSIEGIGTTVEVRIPKLLEG